MAKKQRGKTTSPKKKANNEEPPEKFNLSLESSDDEAPEEVTFKDSKAQAFQSMKQALDRAIREKELLKEKRRKRQELFQEQKKRKLLPAEVLEEIDLSPSKKQKQPEKEAEEEDDDEREEAEGENKKKERTKLPRIRNLKGNYAVTTVAEREGVSFQRQTAENFIQSRLYGPGSCRSTSNDVLSLQNKTGKNKSAAVTFVKKDWASKQKAKAERLKRRWIHVHQMPHC